MYDPLLDFLQNGSKPQNTLPVKYNVQPPPPQSSFLDMLNPMNWIKEKMQSSPEIQEVMNSINQNGGDGKAAFYNECKKRNLDPEVELQKIKNHPLFRKFVK